MVGVSANLEQDPRSAHEYFPTDHTGNALRSLEGQVSRGRKTELQDIKATRSAQPQDALRSKDPALWREVAHFLPVAVRTTNVHRYRNDKQHRC